jgi:hypothetical protein
MDALTNLKGALASGTILQAGGQFAEGAAMRNVAAREAEMYRQVGSNQMAASQREASDIRRKTQLAESRVRAVAAGSGGSSTDAGVQDILGEIGEQGEYNAMAALYEGKEAQRQYRQRAALTKKAGQFAFRSGLVSGASTIMQGASSLHERFGAKSKTTAGGY